MRFWVLVHDGLMKKSINTINHFRRKMGLLDVMKLNSWTSSFNQPFSIDAPLPQDLENPDVFLNTKQTHFSSRDEIAIGIERNCNFDKTLIPNFYLIYIVISQRTVSMVQWKHVIFGR